MIITFFLIFSIINKSIWVISNFSSDSALWMFLKDTSGHYEYVNNTNTTGHLDKFQDNEIVFYENPNGNCFLGHQPDILGQLIDS